MTERDEKSGAIIAVGALGALGLVALISLFTGNDAPPRAPEPAAPLQPVGNPLHEAPLGDRTAEDARGQMRELRRLQQTGQPLVQLGRAPPVEGRAGVPATGVDGGPVRMTTASSGP